MKIIDFLREQGATFADTPGDRQCVMSFSTLEEERKAMLDNGIAYRGERETVIGLGEDFIPLIQGLITGDVFTLSEPGKGLRTCAVNINGRMVFDMRVLHINEMILLDFEPGVVSSGLLSHFKKNIINEDARFLDRSEGVIKVLLSGKKASTTLNAIASLDDELGELQMYHGLAGRFEDDDIIVQRVDFGDIDAFEVMLNKDSFIAFFDAARSQNATPIGEACQEWHRIEKGVLRFSVDPTKTTFGVELSSTVIPLEADLHDWISFTKGCYLGQEIIARLDSRGEPAKKLCRFKLDVAAQVGDEIHKDGKKVGEICSLQPFDGQSAIAIGYVKRKFNALGSSLEIASDPPTITKIDQFPKLALK